MCLSSVWSVSWCAIACLCSAVRWMTTWRTRGCTNGRSIMPSIRLVAISSARAWIVASRWRLRSASWRFWSRRDSNDWLQNHWINETTHRVDESSRSTVPAKDGCACRLRNRRSEGGERLLRHSGFGGRWLEECALRPGRCIWWWDWVWVVGIWKLRKTINQ